MKSTSGLWNSPNTGATNSSGFSALPGGYRNDNSIFFEIGISLQFGTINDSNVLAIGRGLNFQNMQIFKSSYSKLEGKSIRCLKD